MVAVTTTWEIPYAQSFDPFCDGPAITRSMAEWVDELLDTQDAALAMLQRPAYASISVSTSTPTDAEFRIEFDTTEEDTANLVDLAFDPFAITANSTGIWLSGAHGATTTIAPGATETWTVAVFQVDSPVSQSQTIREELTFRAVGSLSANAVFGAPDSFRLDTVFFGSGVTLVADIYKARFWAWRYSDLP
jgi:hypothetical protein